MMKEQTELQKRDVLRLSNEETNRITRECIQSALVVLMSEKPFDKITITEIVKKSGVSRTAFYRNFTSKEDILSNLSDQMLGGITEMVLTAIQDVNPRKLYCDMFRLIQEHPRDFDVLLKAGLLQNEYVNVSTYLDKRYAGFPPMTRYAVLGWWGALHNILQDWYLRGMKESIEEMADFCCRIFENITEAGIQKPQPTKENQS